MNSTLFRTAALVFLLAVVPALSSQGEEGKKMELVWSQSDGLRHEIYSSSCKDAVWSDPIKITDSNANKLHPVLDVAPDGRKWAFWSAITLDGISIEYAVTNKEGKWSEPVKMELNQRSAITPSALIDDSGTVWVVWSGNDGGLDDIYYSRYVNAAWQEPKTVNSANETPDIKPEISRNSQGQIEVRWLGFRDGRYRLLASTYSANGWSAEQEVKQEEEKKEAADLKEEIKAALPAFMPQDSQYSLKAIAR